MSTPGAAPGQKILYIAFNKSIRVEGEKRFLKAGVSNVKIETAHSLAYGGMHVRDRYTLCNGGNMKANEVADLCGIKPTTAGGIKYLILAKHILNCLNLYLNSDIRKLADIDYLSICSEGPVLDFAMDHYDAIYEAAKSLLLRMYKSEIPASHDVYLKLYGLSEPVLPYSHIICDVFKDLSPVTLDIFKKQVGIKAGIGNSQQSIYAFRHAIDSLSCMDESFERFTLFQSFGFPQPVDDLAMRILRIKKLIGKHGDTVNLVGAGTTSDRKTTAVLSRGNIGLLDRAIVNEESIKKLLAADAKPAEKGKVKTPLDLEALNQEINIVALTRTRCHHLLGFDIDEGESLYPTAISPKDFHFGNKTETLIGGPKEKKARKERTAPPEEHDLFSPMGLRAAGAH